MRLLSFCLLIGFMIMVSCTEDQALNNSSGSFHEYLRVRDSIRVHALDSSVSGDSSVLPFSVLITDTLRDTLYDTTWLGLVLYDTVSSPPSIESNTPSEPISGYRYYRYSILEMNVGGGAHGGKTSETCFYTGSDHYPQGSEYSVLSFDSTPNPWGITDIFDDTLGLHANTGGYITIDISNVPWTWVVDMGSSYRFDTFHHYWVEPHYYRVPSHIQIHGSDYPTGPWVLLGEKRYTSAYSNDTVPLSY